MPRTRKRTPRPAAPAYRGLVTPQRLDAFLSCVRERGLGQDTCTLAGLQGFVEGLQATAGFAAVRDALRQASIDPCELCQREGKASVATEHVELDTGMRSVGAFMYACDACRPRAYALAP